MGDQLTRGNGNGLRYILSSLMAFSVIIHRMLESREEREVNGVVSSTYIISSRKGKRRGQLVGKETT